MFRLALVARTALDTYPIKAEKRGTVGAVNASNGAREVAPTTTANNQSTLADTEISSQRGVFMYIYMYTVMHIYTHMYTYLNSKNIDREIKIYHEFLC